jgi:hypothetical protein
VFFNCCTAFMCTSCLSSEVFIELCINFLQACVKHVYTYVHDNVVGVIVVVVVDDDDDDVTVRCFRSKFSQQYR